MSLPNEQHPSLVGRLTRAGVATPPKWLPAQMCYETMMGSIAYGVAHTEAEVEGDDGAISDVDVYGFCIPPKELVFPHLAGCIPGFGRQVQAFDQYQQHHLAHPDKKREYDISIYSIVRYFQLAMENNPNMIDSLFTPQDCVLTCTRIGQIVRDRRKEFLHRGAWIKFRGYAYSQLHKMDNKQHEGKRAETVARYGWDTKYGYHLVRLVLECEQILSEGDIDMRRDAEMLKAIRRGEWSMEDVRAWFGRKSQEMEALYATTKLRHHAPEESIRQLLLDCLESHYGSLKGAVVNPDRYHTALLEIRERVDAALMSVEGISSSLREQ